MICCLNPACHNPPNPDRTMFCCNCGTGLVVLRNRYRPIKTLGGGGFGKTYLAEDLDKLNEYCVIKQFAPRVQGTAAINKATELFEQEARRLQQLGEHPQIPTLLAYFEEENNLYLVQQFINGQNLLAELKQQGTFNAEKIWEVLLDLLNILKTVHQHKVIHRDIKPENIIRRSTDGKLVLIDFGISKQLTMTVITNPGTIIGSPGYAPLEQIQDGKAYPASDLYSVGATCFHLLSGIHPWIMWEQQGYGWVSSWREHLQLPQSSELEKILDKLLQKDYQQRYQSAEEVLQDFTPLPSLSPVHPTQAVVATQSSSSFPATLPHQPQTVTSPAPVKPKVALQKASRQNTNWRTRFLVGAAITIVGTQIYGSVRYGLFPTNPIFLVESFPSSSFLERTLTGYSNSVISIAISPDGKTLASGSYDETIKLWNIQLWNIATGKQIRTFTNSGFVFSIAISRDGKTLASGGWETTIQLWNLATGEQIRTLTGHSDFVNSVAISPDGNTLVSGSSDKTIKLWNLATGELIGTLSEHSNRVSSVAISRDGKTLASDSLDKTIKLWNLATGKEIRTLTGHSGFVRSVAISPDGKILASGSSDKTIKLWNLATGKEIRTLTGHSDSVNSVAISPDGKTLASGSDDNTIKLWNLATGEEIRTLTGHTATVRSVAFNPGSKTLVSSSFDKTIKIWRLK